MLALHLIQNCTVYVNTLMIQNVLAQPHWQGKLTSRDYAALTPLIWEHVNPYGRFRKPITNTVHAIAAALTERANVSVPPVSSSRSAPWPSVSRRASASHSGVLR